MVLGSSVNARVPADDAAVIDPAVETSTLVVNDDESLFAIKEDEISFATAVNANGIASDDLQTATIGFSAGTDLVVLVLVLIKDYFIIKRMLTQKASVYPGFILMSVITS